MKTSIQNPFSGGLQAYNQAAQLFQNNKAADSIQGLAQVNARQNMQDLLQGGGNINSPEAQSMAMGMSMPQQQMLQRRGDANRLFDQNQINNQLNQDKFGLDTDKFNYQQGQDEIANAYKDATFGLNVDQYNQGVQEYQDKLPYLQAQTSNLNATAASTGNTNKLFNDAYGRMNQHVKGMSDLNAPVSKELQGLPALNVQTGGVNPTNPSPYEGNNVLFQQDMAALGTGDKVDLFGNTTQGRQDRLQQMERAFLQSNPNPTPEETQRFYKDAMTTIMAGSSETKSNLGLRQLKENSTKINEWEYDEYHVNPKAANTDAIRKMQEVSRSNYADMSDIEKANVKDSGKSMKANHVFVSGVNKALDEVVSGKLPEMSSGYIDSTKQVIMNKIGIDGDNQALANVNFNTRAGRILASYIKATSGTAASDAERQFLSQILTGNWSDDETTIMARMKEFRRSMIDENNTMGGTLFRSDPYSATKYRQYDNEPSSRPRRTINGVTKYWDGTTWVL